MNDDPMAPHSERNAIASGEMMRWTRPCEEVLDCFSQTYVQSRHRFLAAAGARDAQLTAFDVEGRTPEGEELSTDAAWLGRRDAPAVLIVLSGTHGVEGFCGAAVQEDLLRHAQIPDGIAVLLVHALTPWGFAWHDRTDEEGVDLNRNFVDHSAPPHNSGYDELAVSLMPPDDAPETMEAASHFIDNWRKVHGDRAFATARRAGQYRHPRGLYFGGYRPAGGNRSLAGLFDRYRLADRYLAVVDCHTGLGSFGYGELQSELARDHVLFRRLEVVFGPELVSPYDGSSSSTAVHGTIQDGLLALMGQKPHAYICLEFGTYSPREAAVVLGGLAKLRAGRPVDAAAIRQASRKYFFPDTPGWNEMVLWRSRQVVRRLAQYLIAG